MVFIRFQQLVKDGSSGLYILSIGKLEPNISELSLDITNATLTPDSAVLAKLVENHKAPDDVLKVSIKFLHIDGIGLHDLLSKNQVELKSLHFTNPVVDIYHSKKQNNKEKEGKKDSVNLYQLLEKSIKKIKIGAVIIDNGTFVNHNRNNKNTITHIDKIGVTVKDVLMDSSTQYDRKRFLFAKSVDISLKDYLLRTADSLYFFKASSIEFSAVNHSLTAFNADLVPRGNRAQFEKKLTHRKDMFTIKTRKVILNGINLYDFINKEKLIVNEAIIENCDFSDYFDTSIPSSTSAPTLDDYPHQQLMRATLPVYIKKINVKHLNIKYEELNHSIQQSGSIYFNDVNGQAFNITNMPEQIRKNNKIKFSATALFMNKADLQAVFSLDLKNYKTGHFTVDATLGKLDDTVLNPVCEPLAYVSMKKGTINKVVSHVDGTNYKGTGKLLLLYDDLHLTIFKKDGEGKLKKRGVTGFLANFLLIKNANPSNHKEPRTAECNYTRDPHGSFFNFIFKTILTGALKTVGLPEKLAYQ